MTKAMCSRCMFTICKEWKKTMKNQQSSATTAANKFKIQPYINLNFGPRLARPNKLHTLDKALPNIHYFFCILTPFYWVNTTHMRNAMTNLESIPINKNNWCSKIQNSSKFVKNFSITGNLNGFKTIICASIQFKQLSKLQMLQKNFLTKFVLSFQQFLSLKI